MFHSTEILYNRIYSCFITDPCRDCDRLRLCSWSDIGSSSIDRLILFLIKRQPERKRLKTKMGLNDKSPLLKGTGGGGGSSVIVSYIVVALGLIFVASIAFGLGTVIQGAQIQNTLKNDVLPGLINIVTEPSCDVSSKGQKRRYDAYRIRTEAALYQLSQPLPCHSNNGDEQLYPNTYIGQFTKGLPHYANGLVVPSAYEKLVRAVQSGVPKDYDAIPQGGTRDFTNPQLAYTFTLIGADSHRFNVSAAPAFSSAERAASIIEDYWMALTRDVSFSDYTTDPLIAQAVNDMSTVLSDYRGPPLSTANVFRGTSPGCLIGPFISQFMYQPTPFGAGAIDMTMLPYTANQDFMTNYTEWLRIQNGEQPNFQMSFQANKRYIINARDLAAFVHMDVLYQAYFCAMLQIFSLNAPLKSSIPYQGSELNQMGFGTFGAPFISALVTKIADIALQAAWYQKWNVHRTLRPEAMGGFIHLHKSGNMTFPIHPDALNSEALTVTFSRYGTYLLPQAFPEGSPLHPSYCAGHATVAGACVTILKALYDEDFVIPSPLEPDPNDPANLIPFIGPALTLGNELNKLAWNIGNGRVSSSVHYRDDTVASLKLGEQVAIEYLRDLKTTFTEPFDGWTFRDFDGNEVFV